MAHVAPHLTGETDPQEGRSLFDGRTLTGWEATGSPESWSVDGDSILCTANRSGKCLATTEQFEDFILSLEFRMDPGSNSGVFVRWSNLEDPVNTGIEIQILDSYGETTLVKNSCGALYGLVAPRVAAYRPAGQWNDLTIACDGPLISVRLNGVDIAEADLDQWTVPGMNPDGTTNKFRYAWSEVPRRGHIGLQDHNGRVWFRNIRIKVLDR